MRAVGLSCCLLLLGGGGAAQVSEAFLTHCDPSLRPRAQSPYGYRLRDDRCEGIFVEEVGGTELRIVSFTAWFEEYDLAATGNLFITWKAPNEVSVRLRAIGLRRRLYYQMDTQRPPGSSSYTWPSGVLADLGVSRVDLGILGWTSILLGDSQRWVHVPVTVTQRAPASRVERYQLMLLPGVELQEVFVSFAEVGPNGHPKAFIIRDKPLEYGYYPAGRPVVLPLDYPTAAGIYYVRLGATLRRGGSATADFWFYHPGT